MTLSDWLDAESGRVTRTAAHFGLTPSAVTQWRTNGVPVERMSAIRELTGGAVTLEDMIPPLSPPVQERQSA